MIALWIIALAAGAYQLLAIVVCAAARGQRAEGRGQETRVSILKPVRGVDAGLRDALRSHSELDGDYELLCGVADADDPALAVIREFPKARAIVCPTQAANAKVGVLIDLAREAKNPILIVNDADVRVPRDYIPRVTAPLADPRVGLITCLFRPNTSTFASRIEGLSVTVDFAPGAMIARAIGVDEFAIGATMALRRADLDRIGGFAALADYVADDYQLGKKIHALSAPDGHRKLKCILSDVVVESGLGGGWGDVWSHQVRWARTIRVSKPGGYVGLPITWATFWAVIALSLGAWQIAAGLIALRMAAAILAGWFVLRSRDVLALAWLIPLRDFFGIAVWISGLTGNTVTWRGRRLKLNREGRIENR